MTRPELLAEATRMRAAGLLSCERNEELQKLRTHQATWRFPRKKQEFGEEGVTFDEVTRQCWQKVSEGAKFAAILKEGYLPINAGTFFLHQYIKT